MKVRLNHYVLMLFVVAFMVSCSSNSKYESRGVAFHSTESMWKDRKPASIAGDDWISKDQDNRVVYNKNLAKIFSALSVVDKKFEPADITRLNFNAWAVTKVYYGGIMQVGEYGVIVSESSEGYHVQVMEDWNFYRNYLCSEVGSTMTCKLVRDVAGEQK